MPGEMSYVPKVGDPRSLFKDILTRKKIFHKEKKSKIERRTSKAQRPVNGFSSCEVGLGGLGVTCLPRDPRFAGSNPVEVDGLFQDVKILTQVLREGL